MSFIAYATGSELVYSRYKKLLKKMVLITSMITLSIYIFVSSIFQVRRRRPHAAPRRLRTRRQRPPHLPTPTPLHPSTPRAPCLVLPGA